ncbi:hypothetical protein H257_13204 [Aphanomyces astaci]|uniref:Uncharacterized protein n=1 Tax=Aphanomyces astaci TaxID=112090 RepID=W4FX64_APHAT|nr:hypothetical protein H257_13204 [Aphanomyces astaci]ETV71541.1 hypothetical protein H257_13204 [Aphanomyces astaci]|eukprot:XP_009838974.1 hypothetical protein H257_13204 [Aphanomyces astaci]
MSHSSHIQPLLSLMTTGPSAPGRHAPHIPSATRAKLHHSSQVQLRHLHRFILPQPFKPTKGSSTQRSLPGIWRQSQHNALAPHCISLPVSTAPIPAPITTHPGTPQTTIPAIPLHGTHHSHPTSSAATASATASATTSTYTQANPHAAYAQTHESTAHSHKGPTATSPIPTTRYWDRETHHFEGFIADDIADVKRHFADAKVRIQFSINPSLQPPDEQLSILNYRRQIEVICQERFGITFRGGLLEHGLQLLTDPLQRNIQAWAAPRRGYLFLRDIYVVGLPLRWCARQRALLPPTQIPQSIQNHTWRPQELPPATPPPTHLADPGFSSPPT